jgi:prepilin-type N-terminal cleavage/methylation domain-containing protein
MNCARRILHQPGRAFTLVELLVVIAIVAVPIGLLLPAVQKVRESAARTKCLNNLHQIGVACYLHHDDFGILPSDGWGLNWVGDPSQGNGPSQPGGWIYQILPFIEQNGLYELSTSAAGCQQMIGMPVPVFNCPSRRAGGPYPNSDSIRMINFGGFTPAVEGPGGTTPRAVAARAAIKSCLAAHRTWQRAIAPLSHGRTRVNLPVSCFFAAR